MPPVHPAVVHYPIALMTLSVSADLLGYLSDSPTLQATGTWALLGAGIGAAVAIIAGLFDMKRAKIKHAAHERVHVHMKVGFTLFVAIVGLTIWRWVVTLDPHHGLGWSYLIAAFLVLALTFFQGWLGGELVFTDGVGVARTGQGTKPRVD
ncbi:MAG TPA: DUF2231 domain-containing protein [Pyrinomonadaceae bacterium]|jgi:uncharacterized membrane protein|nr:DUF2231 domain-containing protein [Pyrinomonadaceae bacterium]